jgi:hypothetical protein
LMGSVDEGCSGGVSADGGLRAEDRGLVLRIAGRYGGMGRARLA